MPASRARTLPEFLGSLPEAERREIERVRDLVNRHLPRGYAEGFGYGMIMWSVPLEVLPGTYNGHPLCYVGLAAHKSCNSLHLMAVYGSAVLREELATAFRTAGKRLDMGKSCIHFRAAEDLPLDALGALIARVPMAEYVAMYQASRQRTRGDCGSSGARANPPRRRG